MHDQRIQGHDANGGDQQQVPAQLVDSHTHEERHGHRTPGRDDRGRSGNQQVRDDHGEGRHHHEQQQEDHHEEEVCAAFADVSAGQRAHGASLIALGGPQGAEVVHSGEEYGADGDPEEGREPPQITATAGPTIGAAPATEVKWWPHSTNLFVGT